MTTKTNLDNVLLAIDSFAHLKPLAMEMTDQEIRQRAMVVEKVIRARSKLQQLRNRAEALQGALNRFKAMREALRA